MKTIIYKSFIPQWVKKNTNLEDSPIKNNSIINPTISFVGYKPQFDWSEEQPIQETIDNTKIEESIVRGTTKFRNPDIQLGNLSELVDKFNDAGISIIVTSGLRPGAVTSNNKQSWHSTGWAIDVIPGENETWDSMKTKIKNSPELIQYMKDNKLGILDETDPAMLARTGGTGAHWHIGKDQLAIKGLEELLV